MQLTQALNVCRQVLVSVALGLFEQFLEVRRAQFGQG